MSEKNKELTKLKSELDGFEIGAYTHFNFEISDEENYLCITQRRGGERLQKIILQYSQVDAFVSCIRLVKSSYGESHILKKRIKELEKEINA